MKIEVNVEIDNVGEILKSSILYLHCIFVIQCLNEYTCNGLGYRTS